MDSLLIALFIVLYVLWKIAQWLVNAFDDADYRSGKRYRTYRLSPPNKRRA